MKGFDISLRQGRLQEEGRTIFENFYIHLNDGYIEAVFTSSVEEIDAVIAVLTGKVHLDGGYQYLQGKRVSSRQMQSWFEGNVKVISNQDVLIQGLSIADNFVVCSEKKQPFWNHEKRNALVVQRLLKRFALDIDVRDKVSDLSFRQNFQLMMVKSFFHNKKVILIDRRWMILSEQELNDILETMKLLRQSGMAFVLLGFDIDNIMPVADRVTVVQNGVTLFKEKLKNLTGKETSGLKHVLGIQNTGGYIPEIEIKQREKQVALELCHACTERLKDMNFRLWGGELAVIYTTNHEMGLELYNMLKGKKPLEKGTIKIKDRLVQAKGAVDVRVRDGVQCIGLPDDNDFFFDGLKGWENFALKKGMKEGRIWSHDRMRKHLKAQLEDGFGKDNANKKGGYLTKEEKLMIRIQSQLLEKPTVLVCMEPFSYLNKEERRRAEKLLNTLTAKQVGVVIITSFREEYKKMGASEYTLGITNGFKEYNEITNCQHGR